MDQDAVIGDIVFVWNFPISIISDSMTALEDKRNQIVV